MKKILFLGLCLGGSLFANSYQSTLQELKSILSHPQLQKELNNEVIKQVIKTDKGFSIKSESRAINVNVVYGPGARFGRKDFSLHFCSGKEISSAFSAKSPESAVAE